jgi:hypothetical protein
MPGFIYRKISNITTFVVFNLYKERGRVLPNGECRNWLACAEDSISEDHMVEHRCKTACVGTGNGEK